MLKQMAASADFLSRFNSHFLEKQNKASENAQKKSFQRDMDPLKKKVTPQSEM